MKEPIRRISDVVISFSESPGKGSDLSSGISIFSMEELSKYPPPITHHQDSGGSYLHILDLLAWQLYSIPHPLNLVIQLSFNQN